MKAEDLIQGAVDLLERYRTSVREDFEAIPEAIMWKRPVPGHVSPANLVLHLTGNLRHFFGHHLGKTDYVRQRDREFLDEPYATKEEILAGWERACDETLAALTALDERSLAAPAPIDPYPGGAPVHTMVLRLLTHLTYHAGQIRSMRRMLAPPEP
jgi:uncharacterized damage-inducible protein DinB